MGIQVEYNPDLALRNISHFNQGQRKLEECVPEQLESGVEYLFLKKGQRNYWLLGELPLLETDGNANLSRPLASIIILEAMHFLIDGIIWTKGKYLVKAVFDANDPTRQFEGFERRRS
jgi:hypothetical protein